MSFYHLLMAPVKWFVHLRPPPPPLKETSVVLPSAITSWSFHRVWTVSVVMSSAFGHARHAFRAKPWTGGEGVQTPLMVSHSLPSAKHRINAGLLQSHNGKSNSIIPPLFFSLAHTHAFRPRPPLCAPIWWEFKHQLIPGIQTLFAPALSESFMNRRRRLNCH